MSDASALNPPSRTGRQQRRLRNFLLDKRFQLKYAAMLAGVAIVLSAILGAGLWMTSRRLVTQGQDLVKQGQETVRRGQLVVTESKKVNAVVAMNISKAYGDEPELAKEFKDQTASDEAKFEAEQKRLEADAASLEQRAADLKNQATTLPIVLVIALVVLVVCIGFAGIVVTHKVAGPVFKMQRMFGQVGDGHFSVRERLRKGDEMQSFFESFEQMLGRLRDIQGKDMARIDEAIARIEGSASSDAVETLKKLRAEMQVRRDG
jgi:nitrate/nitrite-specific signal transduction histidine kinase